MKKLTLLSLAMVGLCALPSLAPAEDTLPPKPPGGTEAPKPAADKPAADKPAADKPAAGAEAGKPEHRAGGPGARNPEERLKLMTEKLSLTQDQQDKIKAIYAKNAPEMRDLFAKGRDNLTDADKEKLRELMKTQMEEVGAILTPEQREKAKEMRGAREGGKGAGKAGKPGEAK